VSFGKPKPLDPGEPFRLAASIAALRLKYSVITCVDRDDLSDSGAAHWAACLNAVRTLSGALEFEPGAASAGAAAEPYAAGHRGGVGLEILSGDFKGRIDDIATVVRARPDVFAHNVETVPRLQKLARHKATWDRSVFVLDSVRAVADAEGQPIFTKTGLMLGLGETNAEVREALQMLREHEIDLLTLGQYLRPRNVEGKLPVQRFVTPEEFEELRQYGLALGFKGVAASPLTRSSHLAETLYAQARLGCA
jgi:lipoic acid synthetase